MKIFTEDDCEYPNVHFVRSGYSEDAIQLVRTSDSIIILPENKDDNVFLSNFFMDYLKKHGYYGRKNEPAFKKTLRYLMTIEMSGDLSSFTFLFQNQTNLVKEDFIRTFKTRK